MKIIVTLWVFLLFIGCSSETPPDMADITLPEHLKIYPGATLQMIEDQQPISSYQFSTAASFNDVFAYYDKVYGEASISYMDQPDDKLKIYLYQSQPINVHLARDVETGKTVITVGG